MMTQGTYQKKYRLLVAGMVVMAFVAYFYGIKLTINVASECGRLGDQLELTENAPEKIASLESQLERIKGIVGKTGGEKDLQESLLEKASRYCQDEGIILKELPRTITVSHKDYQLETNVITLQGGYVKLLRFVHLLEQEYNIGKLVSVKFVREYDFKSKRHKLNATIYVQNIKNIENED